MVATHPGISVSRSRAEGSRAARCSGGLGGRSVARGLAVGAGARSVPEFVLCGGVSLLRLSDQACRDRVIGRRSARQAADRHNHADPYATESTIMWIMRVRRSSALRRGHARTLQDIQPRCRGCRHPVPTQSRPSERHGTRRSDPETDPTAATAPRSPASRIAERLRSADPSPRARSVVLCCRGVQMDRKAACC